MHGCPACTEYLPRLQAAARRHPTVPLYVLETSEHEKEADQFKVSAVPATFVLRGSKYVTKTGALSEDEIEYNFRLAEHYA